MSPRLVPELASPLREPAVSDDPLILGRADSGREIDLSPARRGLTLRTFGFRGGLSDSLLRRFRFQKEEFLNCRSGLY